jgi:hypothetical protein
MNNSKQYSSRTADKFVIRLLDNMREQIKEIADGQHRSMNSELISWIEMMLEIHKETGSIPNLDMLRSTAQMEAQNRLMRAMLLKLLNAGGWHHSAVELEQHIDGKNLEQEIKNILAQDVPDVGHAVKQSEPVKLRPYQIPPLTLPKPRFTAKVNDPVSFDHNGKYKLGVVTKIWVDTYGGFEKFKARVEMRGAGNVEVWLDELNEPDHL